MSYHVAVTKVSLPQSNRKAWQYVMKSKKRKNKEEGNEDFLIFVTYLQNQLNTRFEQEDVQISISHQSDANFLFLNIDASNILRILLYLIDLSRECGYTLFDFHTETIYRPQE